MSTARALWLLSRPRLLPAVVLLVLGGFGLAHWDRALPLRGAVELSWVLAAWIALNAGTLWLNASVDRDEGEVFYGEAVAPPAGLAGYAYAALAVCVALALPAGPVCATLAAACAALAVLYSHPRTLWKGHPVLGPAVNVVGYGWLSPLAGAACLAVPLTARVALIVGIVGVAVLGGYFAAQAFQHDEDRARGYRTLVVTHGPRTTVWAARLCLGIAWGGVMVLAVVGWLPRALLLGLPLWLWVDRYATRWLCDPEGGTEADARELARRVAWVVLAGFLLIFAQYVVSSFAGEPVAGLGTAAGHPPLASDG